MAQIENTDATVKLLMADMFLVAGRTEAASSVLDAIRADRRCSDGLRYAACSKLFLCAIRMEDDGCGNLAIRFLDGIRTDVTLVQSVRDEAESRLLRISERWGSRRNAQGAGP